MIVKTLIQHSMCINSIAATEVLFSQKT